MGTVVKEIMTAVFLGMILPGLLLNGAVMALDRMEPEVEIEAVQTIPQPTLSMTLRHKDGAMAYLDMDAYLVGVLLAEVPASFEMEALKAQAVAARTYTLKAGVTGGKHGDGSVCSQASCCQGYLTEEDYLLRGGSQAGIDRICQAVTETTGQCLTYHGELIEACYFSCSGGSTEDALAVWGTDYPYLQSVSSPGEEEAAYYEDAVVYTPQQFQDALGRDLEGDPWDWFGTTVYTRGGGVDTMEISGMRYTGTQLRSLLGLRSTAFLIDAGESITITTRGYGHRVGMSQYGADAMAVQGRTYPEILAHYYPGTMLISWDPTSG